MIGVNLIPQSLREARRHRRLVVRWTVGGGIYALLLVLVCVVARSLYMADCHALDQQTGDMIHRIATADQISRSLKSQLVELHASSQTAHAIADRSDWSMLLSVLANTMDDELALRDVRISPVIDAKTVVVDPLSGPRKYSLTIRGLGENSMAVSKFVSHLEETKFFDEVKLSHTGREPFMTGMAVSFDLDCTFGSATVPNIGVTNHPGVWGGGKMNPTSLNRMVDEFRVALFGIAAIIVMSGVAYFAEFAPIVHDRDSYVQSVADLNAKQQTLDHLQGFVSCTAQQQVKTLSDQQASELKLQPAQQINDRISMISSIATDQGLVLESTEPGNAIPQQRYSTVAIHITGHGGFRQCVKFLRELRRQLPDVAVNDVGLAGGADGGTVNLTLSLVWYAAPDSAVAKTDPN